MHPEHRYFGKRTAVLATMHGKEKVIAPLLKQAFDMDVFVPAGLDTDRFGTFTREVRRPADQHATARLKALRAMEYAHTDIGIASEGSFGTNAAMPFMPCNTEIIVLIDRRHDLEIVGGHMSYSTHMHHAYVTSAEDACAFAIRHDFPNHGLVLRPNEHSKRGIRKDISSVEELKKEVKLMLRRSWFSRRVFLESDMRADHNPTRMINISEAAANLIQNMRRNCPRCFMPGFDYDEVQKGLPCFCCGQPTNSVLSHVYRCKKCSFKQKKYFPYEKEAADPGECQHCNP